jgi:hypothetical protein
VAHGGFCRCASALPTGKGTMSYLDNLRLVFAGDFQADVSTVNNDVHHYDNATFEARFQQFPHSPGFRGRPMGHESMEILGEAKKIHIPPNLVVKPRCRHGSS